MQTFFTSAAEWSGPFSELAVKATALLAFAWMLALVLFRAPAAMRHVLWLGVMAGSILLPAAILAGPPWRILPAMGKALPKAQLERRELPSPQPALEQSLARPVILPHMEAPPASEDVATPNITVPLQATQPQESAAILTPPQTPARTGDSGYYAALIWIWLAGIACMLARILWGTVVLRQFRQTAQTPDAGWLTLLQQCQKTCGVGRRVFLGISSRATMPLTFGILRPCIMLPPAAAEWPERKRRLVLLHELTHIARADVFAQLIASLARAAYWFHPLMWLATRQMEIERERACDDQVVSLGADSAAYAETLLDIAAATAGKTPTAIAGLAMARPSFLEKRVRRVLDEKSARGAVTFRAAAAVMVLIICGTASIGILKAAGEAPSTAPYYAPAASRPADSTPPANTREFYIAGLVSRPGCYSLDGMGLGKPPLLYEALELAGLQMEPKDYAITLIRQIDASHETFTVIPGAELMRPRYHETTLEPHDLLVVMDVNRSQPEGMFKPKQEIIAATAEFPAGRQEMFSILGPSVDAGTYAIASRKQTLRQALVLAHLRTFDNLEVVLYRRKPDTTVEAIRANVAALFDGREQDRFLQPNDVINLRNISVITAPANATTRAGTAPANEARSASLFEIRMLIAPGDTTTPSEELPDMDGKKVRVTKKAWIDLWAFKDVSLVMPFVRTGDDDEGIYRIRLSCDSNALSQAMSAMGIDEAHKAWGNRVPDDQWHSPVVAVVNQRVLPGPVGYTDYFESQLGRMKLSEAIALVKRMKEDLARPAILMKEALAQNPAGSDAVPIGGATTAPGALEIVPADVELKPDTPGEFYMTGQIPRIGVYSMTGRKITLKQATVAGGIDVQQVDGLTVEIVRRVPGDQEKRFKVNLGAIFAGTAPDLYLQANDVIMVGTTKAATRAADEKPDPATELEQLKNQRTLIQAQISLLEKANWTGSPAIEELRRSIIPLDAAINELSKSIKTEGPQGN